MTSLRHRLFRNVSWLFVERLIQVAGGLVIGIWVARYLGPNDFGILSYALAYTALFMLFVKLGLDQIIVREIVRKPRLTPYLLGTAFAMKLGGAMLALLLVWLSFFAMDTDQLTRWVIMIAATGFVAQSIDVVDYYFQAKILSKYVVMARAGAFVLSSLLKVYFILGGFDVRWFALAGTIDFFLVLLFLAWVYRGRGPDFVRWRFSRTLAWRLVCHSWPLALSLFLISIHTKIDQVMIGNMLDKEQVGLYSVAVRLTEVWVFVPTIIVSTLMPYFVGLRDTDCMAYRQRLLQLYSFMFWMGALVGTGATLFGEPVIRLLFGEEYSGAYAALVLNIWNGIFIAHGQARGIWLISEGFQKYRLYNNLFAVAVNILANVLLIPRYGISGAATATLLTQGLTVWFFSLTWKPLRSSTLDLLRSMNPKYLLTDEVLPK